MKKIFLPLLVLCGFLVGCQHEIDDPTTPVPPTDTSAIYLDKVYYTRGSGATLDTFAVDEFSYDNLKRVVRFHNESNIVYDPIFGQDPFNDTANWTFVYQGSDMLPVSSTLVGHGTISNTEYFDTSTVYYSFNAQKQRVKDSALIRRVSLSGGVPTYDIETGVINYRRVGANEYLEYHAVDGTNTITRRDTTVFDGFGNAVSTNIVAPNFSQNETVTYDNRISPIGKLNIYEVLGNTTDNFRDSFYLPMSKMKNNPLTIKETFPGTSVEGFQNFSGRYVYRADGYPIALIPVMNESFGLPFGYTFTYKRL